MDALELLKNFDELSDDALVSPKEAAIILRMSERTLRRNPPVPRVQTSPQRYGFRAGALRKFARHPEVAA